ncbi:hypothetical protein AMC87_PD00893 (plasmid) [Rhizobium phaseoli]|nr:hypothetical protein AMC87_PD00893 [Rhizobium phaseoli]
MSVWLPGMAFSSNGSSKVPTHKARPPVANPGSALRQVISNNGLMNKPVNRRRLIRLMIGRQQPGQRFPCDPLAAPRM